jgi:hypothetical protein
MTGSDEEPPLEAVGRDGVRGPKRPVQEDGLHVSKPWVIQSMQRMRACPSMPGAAGRQAQHDLRLDAGFCQTVKRNLEPVARELLDRAVVDIAPDRRVDPVFRPDGPVGEPDLAADRTLSARFSLHATAAVTR